jgi:hypothetical protein
MPLLLVCAGCGDGCGTKSAVTMSATSEQPALPVALEQPPPTADATVERVKTLLARINDDPDILHADYTPAVHELVQVGEPALAPTLELMLSDDRHTRMRAQRVLEGVTLVQHGFVFGQGWKEDQGEKRHRKFWSELGKLDYDAPPDKRAAGVAMWKKWLAGRVRASPVK